MRGPTWSRRRTARSASWPEGGEVQVISSGWRLALREFMTTGSRCWRWWCSSSSCCSASSGRSIYHTNQTESDILNTDLPPGRGHLLGTDENGFDELGRIMIGGQAALEIGFFAASSRP